MILLLLAMAPGLIAQPHEQALSPAAEMGTFRLEPGLTVELVAAEPQVVSPVAMSFDRQGRLYVAENRGYPEQENPPMGRIALLEDKDADGRFETRHEFAQGLTFPNGVLAWSNGVIVTCAPDVLFLRDRDGDGRADERKVLLMGFATNGSTQLRVSHPTFAPDNWIYLSGGLMGGKVSSPARPDLALVDISRSEIRFNPATGDFEAVDGKGQFGLSFTDFGHRFTCMNRVHIQHVVLSGKHLERNPNLAFTDRMQDVPEGLDPGLKVGPPAARIYPISQNLTTADSHEGTFTAACGVTVYASDGLPSEMHGNVFTCDPAANLVHRDLLEKRGATFAARRATDRTEFLASSDDWFRPVALQVGPDGALYICDMYRKTIEHPVYLPDEVRKRTDFESGRNKGRIYRVRKAGRVRRPELPGKNVEAWTRELASPNQWLRETAQQLLLEAPREETAGAVRNVLKTEGVRESAYARARALELLQAKDALTQNDLLRALLDDGAGVRQVALRLAEAHLRKAPASEISQAVLARVRDSDSHVRFQAGLAIGELRDNSQVSTGLADLAVTPNLDRWTRAALLSSAHGKETLLLKDLLRRGSNVSLSLVEELARMASPTTRDDDILRSILADHDHSKKLAVLNGWFGARRAAYEPFASNRLGTEAAKLERAAAVQALDAQQSLEVREAAIRFHRFLKPSQLRAALDLFGPGTAARLQRSLIDAVLAASEPSLIFELFQPSHLRRLSPELREQAASGAVGNATLAMEFLRRVQNGEIPANIISPTVRRRLQASNRAEVRNLAVELFKSAANPDRHAIYEEWRGVLELKSDSNRGRAVFTRLCANCHRLDRIGMAVGPDLFSIRNQPKESILLHIINPDLEITAGFNNYTAELRDGRTISGIVRSETENAVTFRLPGGQDETIARAEIASLEGSVLSMMPQELEKAMNRQEMADLLGFLKGE